MTAYLLVIENLLPFFCGAKDGGIYDFGNACPNCGTGAQRITPLTLPMSGLKNRVSNTLKFEVVIPPRLVSAIMSVAPQCLKEIRDATTGAETGFFQLIPEITLPKWSSATTGFCLSEMDPPCSTCKRDGYFNITKIPLKLSYSDPVPSFSVAETYERFGKSRLNIDFQKSLFATPYLVISEAVKKTIEGESGLSFIPVAFMN